MVLVTGAAGHLGSALVRELAQHGEKIRAFVLPQEDTDSLNGIPLEVVRGNVVDEDSVRDAMRGIDVVYHLAGIISIMPGKNDRMRQVNVTGTTVVARAAREAGVRRMVDVSSIHALARPAEGIPIDESVPFDPLSEAGEYDRTKAEAALAVLAEVSRGLDAVIVCPTGIIGPHYTRGGSPMLGLIKKWMKPGLHVVVAGHFDFVDVRDVARGMVLAAEKGKRGETYILRGERVPLTEAPVDGPESHGVPGNRHRRPGPAGPVGSHTCHPSRPALGNAGRVHTLRPADGSRQLHGVRGQGTKTSRIQTASLLRDGRGHGPVAVGEPRSAPALDSAQAGITADADDLSRGVASGSVRREAPRSGRPACRFPWLPPARRGEAGELTAAHRCRRGIPRPAARRSRGA